MRTLGAVLLAAFLALPAQAQDAQPMPPAVGPPTTPEPPPLSWVAGGTADLVALDKISTRTFPLTAKVGQPVQFGTLTITVGACDVRPPGQPADAAAWLDVTDGNAGVPAFHGWILKAEPAVSGLEHPIYDLRLAACR